MGLSSAISTAVTGLRATQAGMEVVSQNVANAGTVGYSRRTLATSEQFAGSQGVGVRVLGAQRVLDTLVQRQLRLESSGAAYTGVKAEYHTALDGLFDAPGSSTSLPSLLSAMASSFSALQTNPSSYTTRAGVVSAAFNLASSLNGLTDQVQALRQNAEDAIGQAVGQANDLLSQIASVSSQMRASSDAAASPALQDRRDTLIDQLSELMDVKVDPAGSGSDVRISTTGGLQLFDGTDARTLSFDARVAIGPQNLFDRDPAKRSVGTITATDGVGRQVDVLATGGIRSGTIAAFIELRDQVLPEAQTQLDALAGGLASALSDRPIAGTAATAGAATGFDVDLGSLAVGNPLTVAVRQGDATRTVTFVKATNAAGASAASASGDGVIGLDFSGGTASVASQIAAALGSGFAASNPSGTTVRILDDGAANATDVKSVAARATATGLTGSTALPLFQDGASPYTGSYQAGSQLTGFAGRIAVNAAVKADPSTLVAYAAGVEAGDTARPTFLNEALRTGVSGFTGRAGIAGSTNRFTGTVSDFATQLVTTQATNANAATSLNDGQKVVLASIQGRMSAQSGVNVDTEMAQLIQLQTAYGANARVMSAAKDMLDMLLRVGL